MSTTKITERNLDEEFLQNLYTKDNPPTASDIGAVPESELATAIQSLIDSGVIEVGEKAYTPSSNLLKNVLASEKQFGTEIAGSSKSYYIAKWVPEYSGAVKILFSLKTSQYQLYGVAYTSTMAQDGYASELSRQLAIVENSSEGSVVSVSCYGDSSQAHVTTSSTSYTNSYLIVEVKKGVPVYFLLNGAGTSSGATYYCNRVAIYADEV